MGNEKIASRTSFVSYSRSVVFSSNTLAYGHGTACDVAAEGSKVTDYLEYGRYQPAFRDQYSTLNASNAEVICLDGKRLLSKQFVTVGYGEAHSSSFGTFLSVFHQSSCSRPNAIPKAVAGAAQEQIQSLEHLQSQPRVAILKCRGATTVFAKA